MEKEYSMGSKLIPIFGMRKQEGSFGIEIETETLRSYEPPSMKFWKPTSDGSLRNFGVEYVLKSPQTLEQVMVALEEFEAKTEGLDFIKDSPSTSVHVHVNILNETVKTVGNIITTFLAIESLLLHYSGPLRTENLFCLGGSDAEEIVNNMGRLFRYIESDNWVRLNEFNHNNSKYAALNISSINSFGSLEFRSFRGTTDIKEIADWISIINSILMFSREDLTPKDIIKNFLQGGVSFFQDALGEDTWSKIFSGKEEEIHSVNNNIWNASSVAFSVTDWSSFTDTPRKKILPEDLEEMAQKIFGKTFDQLTRIEVMSLHTKLKGDPKNSLVNKHGPLVINGIDFGALGADEVPEDNEPIGRGIFMNDLVEVLRAGEARINFGAAQYEDDEEDEDDEEFPE